MDYSECLLPAYLIYGQTSKTPFLIHEMLGYSFQQDFKAYIEYQETSYSLTFLSPQHRIWNGNCFQFDDLNQKLFPNAAYLNYLLKTGPYVVKLFYDKEVHCFQIAFFERDCATNVNRIQLQRFAPSIFEAFEEMETAIRMDMRKEGKLYTLEMRRF